jgi:hypothetical protein
MSYRIKNFNRSIFRLIFGAGLFLLAFCANQIGPTGGPADTVPPAVREITPANGAVNVSKNTSINIVMSEWVAPQNIEKCLAFFPPPAKGMTVRVKGKKIEIIPKPSLADSTTYHIEINNTLKDLNGNPVGKPFVLIFSTGPSLDSGRISGCLVDPSGKIIQPKVALFSCTDTMHFADTILFGTPSYLAQTDSFGVFTLNNIRHGMYRAFAFVDNNNNNRFDPDREAVYSPVERYHQLIGSIDTLLLFPATCDTTSQRITSVKPLDSMVLSCEWNRRGVQDSILDNSIRIITLDPKAKAPTIKRIISLKNSKRMFLELGKSMELVPYKLVYKIGKALPSDTMCLMDSIRFNGALVKDTVWPSLVLWDPRGDASVSTSIKTIWSKPVRILDSIISLKDTIGDTVNMKWDTTLSDTIQFRPVRHLIPGRYYKAAIPVKSIIDMAGNSPKDTTGFIKLSIWTTQGDSLCPRFSGGAACLPCHSQRIWQFNTFGLGGRTSATRDSCGKFTFDSIDPGKGSLSYFVDYNFDGKPTNGSLFPWRSPEPHFTFSDTVEARVRWEIENVAVPACITCARRR